MRYSLRVELGEGTSQRYSNRRGLRRYRKHQGKWRVAAGMDKDIALVEERSRHIESLRREAEAVRQDDTLSKQLGGVNRRRA